MTLNDLIKKASNLKGFVSEKHKFFMHGNHRAIVFRGHIDKRVQRTCPVCGKACPGYDTSSDYKRIRGLDMGTIQFFIEIPSERVCCPEHGVITAALPFARHKSRFTRDFEDMVVARTKDTSFSAVAKEMRIDWHTVETIVGHVAAEKLPSNSELFDNLKRIGIDETSYKKGHKYLTIVVNHDTNEVIFCKEGHDYKTLASFFEMLTEEQRASIETVTGDGARWIKKCVDEFTNANFCIDRFHVTQWAIEALDEMRKKRWRAEQDAKKKAGRNPVGRPKKSCQTQPSSSARTNKSTKYALGKNPDNLTAAQKERFEEIRRNDYYLFRGWELKEHLRRIFTAAPDELETQLKGWLAWACRCRIPEFVELSKKIRRHKDAILKTVQLGLSNARIEATNNKIKLLIKRAYGFRNIENLKALIRLYNSRVELSYPGRGLKWSEEEMAADW